MKSLVRIVLVLGLLAVVGAVALSMRNIPVPSAKVEKVIPDDRFQH